MATTAGPIPAAHSPSTQSRSSVPTTSVVQAPYYGHERTANICSRFIQSLFPCADVPESQAIDGSTNASTTGQSLEHFIAYALHRTRLRSNVTFAALLLLSRLKAKFPNARAASARRLFITAFMVAQKVLDDDYYSHKSWCIVAQGLSHVREVRQMENELSSYLQGELTITDDELWGFETTVRRNHDDQDPMSVYNRVVAALQSAAASSSPAIATPVATPHPLAQIQDGQNALALFSRQRVWIRDNLQKLDTAAHPADRLLETLDSIVARFESMRGGGPHRRILELIARARAIIEEEFGDGGEARSFREAYRAFYKLLSKEDGAGRMTWTEQCIKLHAELVQRARNMTALSVDQLQHLQGLMHEFEASKDALSHALSGTADAFGSEKLGGQSKTIHQHPLVVQLELGLKDMIRHQRVLTQYWKDQEQALSALGADPGDKAQRQRQSDDWGSIGQAAFAADPCIPQLPGGSAAEGPCVLPPSPATAALEASVDAAQLAASGYTAVDREVLRAPSKNAKPVAAALEETRDELSTAFVEQRSALRQCAAFAHTCSATLQSATDGSVAADVAVLVRKLRVGVVVRAEAYLAQLVGLQARFSKLSKRLGALLDKWAPPAECNSFAPRHWQMFAVEISSTPTHPIVVNTLAQLAFLCDKPAQTEHWIKVKSVLLEIA